MTKIALSIDWDFFFDDTPYDWGHREAPFFIETIWQIRAIDFLIAGKNYRDYKPEGTEQFLHMLKKLNLIPPALYVSESHLHAYNLYRSFPPDLILHFDAHPDASRNHPEFIDCENWLYWLLKRNRKTKAIWIHPDHIDPHSFNNIDYKKLSYIAYSDFENAWNVRLKKEQDNVVLSYMCRSGAWTPPWADDDFDKLRLDLSRVQMFANGKLKHRTLDEKAISESAKEIEEKRALLMKEMNKNEAPA